MAIRSDLLTIGEVSDLLGVEARQVRGLAETGAITRVARGVFDRTSVERYRAQRGSGRTRTWAEHTAWGAIALLAGADPVGVGDVQVSRLRGSLRAIDDVSDLVVRLRDRAGVTVWSGHRSVAGRVRADLVVPSRGRLGLVKDDAVVDGYIHADQVAGIVRRYRLSEDAAGTITLRSTRMDLDYVSRLAVANSTLAATDAATSLDPRERGVGQRVLDEQLKAFRTHGRS